MLFIISLLMASRLTASAALIPRDTPCSFVMNAVGSPNGSVVEDTVGDNRIGGPFPQGNYYISNGSLFDSLRHECLISRTSSRFHCTSGAHGASKFSIANDGSLLHDGVAKWVACPASGPANGGSYDIFGDSKANTTGCEPVTLRTGGFNCTALGRPSTSASSLSLLATPTAANISSVSTSATPTLACPTDISGAFQFPHLIIPTSPEEPNHAFGNSYSAYISPVNTTLFNFDIPPVAPYQGTCALLFLFPFGGATYFSGVEEEESEKGGLDFALLADVANVNTTYATTGNISTDFGKVEVLPGNNYTIATFYCETGSRITYSVSSRANVELDYFQSQGPNPMGLYLVPCS